MRKADSDDEGGEQPALPTSRPKKKSVRVAKNKKQATTTPNLNDNYKEEKETLFSKSEDLKQKDTTATGGDEMGDRKPASKPAAASPEPSPLPLPTTNTATQAEEHILPGAFRMRPSARPTPADGLAEGEREFDPQGSRASLFTTTEKEDTLREPDNILIEATLVADNETPASSSTTKRPSSDGARSVDPEPPELVMGHPMDLAAMLKLDAASTRDERDRFRSMILALVGCLVVVLIVLGIVLGVTLSQEDGELINPPQDTSSPTMAPTPFVEYVLPLYTQEALKDPTSPQSRAYEWVQNDMEQTNPSESMTTYFPLQRFVLATLYYSLQGAQWTKQDKWLEAGTDPCDWYTSFYGSICTTGNRRKQRQLRQRGLQEEEERKYYHQLSLYRNNLAGTLPPEIGLLSKLDFVNLFENKITGSIPSEIGLWQDATFLQLVNNSLTGTLPSQIGQMSQMGILSVAFNRLTGTLPSELGRLSSNLKTFSVSNNAISGGIPTEFGGLAQLEGLHLYENPNMDGHLLSELGKLVRLKHLQMNAIAGLTGKIPSELGLLGDLEEIQLQDTSITGTIPDSLGSLSKLTLLALHNANLSGEMPSQVCELMNSGLLREISVDCDKVQCSADCKCDCNKSPRSDQINPSTTQDSAVAEELITDAPITVSAEVETAVPSSQVDLTSALVFP